MSLKKINPNKSYTNKELANEINRLNIALEKFMSSINNRLNEIDDRLDDLEGEGKHGKGEEEFPDYILLNWEKGTGKCTNSKVVEYSQNFKYLQEVEEDNFDEPNNRTAIYKLVKEYE